MADEKTTVQSKKNELPRPVDKDEKGNVLPLENTSLVRLKNTFHANNGVSYEPRRFGTVIPEGTVLPRTAVILDDDYKENKTPPPSKNASELAYGEEKKGDGDPNSQPNLKK